MVVGAGGGAKSALLEYAAGAAPDLRVVRASGVESEMELAFAGLHQLCAPPRRTGWQTEPEQLRLHPTA